MQKNILTIQTIRTIYYWIILQKKLKTNCDLKSLLPRSGHSACVYEDWMLIFGGIHEITKELEDMAVYNFKTQEWIHFFKTAQDKAMKK